MTAGTAAPATSDRDFLVAAAAANLAGWHDVHVRALGFSTEWRDGLWLTPDAVPAIFFHAIAVRPGASAATIGERVARHRWASVSDPWADLPMPAQGYALDGDHAWMVRQPGAILVHGVPPDAVSMPADLVVEQVEDPDALADFERVAALGFGSQPRPSFSWHAPPLLADPRLQIWRGRVDGATVAVSMGFADAGVLGIYGVAALPEARRRGYGSALTRHTIEAGPALPAVLQPSTMAERLYARLGFQRFTSFRAWERYPGPAPTTDDQRPEV
jgi:GNAT superfamily N-acetyltransferase